MTDLPAVRDPVIIAAFRSRDEALFARALLRYAEIDAEVRAFDPAIPRMCVGAFESGFDAVVARIDADEATALLQRLWREESDARPLAYAQCPSCGSLEVTRLRRQVLFVAAAALLFIGGIVTGERDLFLLMIVIAGIILLVARANRCRACGHRWRGEGEPVAPEDAIEIADVLCPRCGSSDTARIPRRREKATTLLVNMLVPPLLFVWPFLPRWKCAACGKEWR